MQMVVVASRMSAIESLRLNLSGDWNIKDVTAKYPSITAKFKILISYITGVNRSDWEGAAMMDADY